MRIQINSHYLRGKTGKSKFANRLVRAWKEMGVNITEDPKAKADIALNVGRCHYSNKARKQVLRVGPACISTQMNYRKINHEKAQSIKKADAIIYQSKYSKKIYHKLVCHPDKPETIIFNGADPREYNIPSHDDDDRINFMASTRVWLKQKRLKQIVKAFNDANIANSYIYILGDSQGIWKKYLSHNVIFCGLCDDDTIANFYCKCNAMIHLTYVDASPNSVVEAQIAGLPVICTDQGGTKEILRYGKVLKDKPFKYKPINLDKPPKINQEELINAMKSVLTWKHDNIFAKDLYIDNIARQYLTFFERVL